MCVPRERERKEDCVSLPAISWEEQSVGRLDALEDCF